MAQGLLYGAGFLCIETKGTTKKGFFPAPINFQLEGNSEEVTAKGFANGVEVITGSALKAENYKMKLAFEALSWLTMQLCFGRLAATSTNIEIPQVRTRKIDSAGEVIDSDILSTVGPPAFSAGVIVTNPATDTLMTETNAGSAANITSSQYIINRTNTRLGFNPSLAGKTINYRVITKVPSIETIGLELGTEKFDSVSFVGTAYGSGGVRYGQLVIPDMARVKVPSLSFDGNASKAEIEYRVNTTDASELGWYITKLHT